MLFSSFYFFCFSIQAKNSIKKFNTRYFFSLSSNSLFFLFSSTSSSKKFNVSNVFCFKEEDFKVEDFFISLQFLISFRFITPITWYNNLFIQVYFASTRLFVFRNIFSALFFWSLKRVSLQAWISPRIFCIFQISFELIVFDFYFDWIDFYILFKTFFFSYLFLLIVKDVFFNVKPFWLAEYIIFDLPWFSSKNLLSVEIY